MSLRGGLSHPKKADHSNHHHSKSVPEHLMSLSKWIIIQDDFDVDDRRGSTQEYWSAREFRYFKLRTVTEQEEQQHKRSVLVQKHLSLLSIIPNKWIAYSRQHFNYERSNNKFQPEDFLLLRPSLLFEIKSLHARMSLLRPYEKNECECYMQFWCTLHDITMKTHNRGQFQRV